MVLDFVRDLFENKVYKSHQICLVAKKHLE